MEIDNLAGKWPNVAINPANGLPYKCDRCAELAKKLETYGKVPDQDEYKKQQLMESGDTREQLEADLCEWIDIATYKAFEPERMLEVMHYWLNRQADITWDNAWKEQKKLIATMQDEIEYLRKVCRTQADSFAAIENENTELRSKLNHIRKLAERLQDA